MSEKPAGLTIPWPLIGVAVPILAGVIWINVQLWRLTDKVDFLWRVEMERHPRQGPVER